ncbi:MAG: hypothetical protein Q8R28_13505, partial [Dehalococcoidia bacterium]|nr:hypothetical protein [Dehalococcoidia bacterium]
RKHFKGARFDFDKKQLVGSDGYYLQWRLRAYPNKPEDYNNQQTSTGNVGLWKLGGQNNPRNPAQRVGYSTFRTTPYADTARYGWEITDADTGAVLETSSQEYETSVKARRAVEKALSKHVLVGGITADNPEGTDDPFAGADVIFSYSRAQAIEDGMLVDVSSTGREAGFRAPLAVTTNLFHEWVEIKDDDEKVKGYGQSTKGRLWDVVYLAATRFRAAMRKDQSDGGPHAFQVIFQAKPRTDKRRHVVTLWVQADGEGVTIMLPEDY